MNKLHLQYCGSDEWGETVREHILPWVLQDHALEGEVLEVGPGPGRTTEVLRTMTDRLTAVEIDPALADALEKRLGGPGLRVVQADATALPFEPESFDVALSFTMLHHVPSPEEQDRLFASVARVLRTGGRFAGTDSLDSPQFREGHIDDICVPLDPATVAARLEAAGFEQVEVQTNPYAFRFSARKA